MFCLLYLKCFSTKLLGFSSLGENNSQTSYFLGFSVYISNKTNKEDGVLCFRDTNYTKATIPNPVYIICPYHGRYVIYYNNRTNPSYPAGYSGFAYIEICELEVYGKKDTDPTSMWTKKKNNKKTKKNQTNKHMLSIGNKSN